MLFILLLLLIISLLLFPIFFFNSCKNVAFIVSYSSFCIISTSLLYLFFGNLLFISFKFFGNLIVSIKSTFLLFPIFTSLVIIVFLTFWIFFCNIGCNNNSSVLALLFESTTSIIEIICLKSLL